MKKAFVLFIIICILILGDNMIEALHNTLIFAPTREFIATPDTEGINYEEVFIKTEDGETLYGYFLPYKDKTKNTILYLHGNADNISSWYTACTEIQKKVPVNALVVDYRGYGKSTGSPTRIGVIKDAVAMYDFLIEKGYSNNEISIYGRSIGGAIGLELAKRKEVKSIVLQSSFTCIRDIAKDIYPIFPQAIIKNDLLNSAQIIKGIKIPILISHGALDETVPVKHSYKLFELANEPKKLIILEGAGHNDVASFFNKEYFDFLKELFTA